MPDKSKIYSNLQKIERKIIRVFNPNPVLEDEASIQQQLDKDIQQQLDKDIAVNFGLWQPLPITYPGTGKGIKIGEKTYPSLAVASTALQDHQTLLIGEGVYTEPLVINRNHVQIIGSGRVVFDGASAEGKAAIITKGKQITISNIECKNIAVADQNGACIRSEGAGLTVEHVYFHDSEQGILSSNNQSLRISDSRFEKLGKNGRAHGIYIDGGEVLIDHSWFIASKSEGHEIKSRASKTVIKNCVIASLSAVDSRLVDVSNGGELVIENSVLEKGPQSANATAIGYGLEGITHQQNAIILEKNVVILERDGHNVLLDARPEGQVPVKIVGNIIVSKDEQVIDGLNWLFSSRQEARMGEYPQLPVLENQQKPLK
ncbi:MAG: right-handed parallel beta-helix repeat-containing protein [Methylovulum sp.]|uniref:right-handed parallel beta-helix repeat-containing protein n=1 Tax=Methylovulum sp. TaxID=1916980 RepID=UPI002605D0C3|nr:right-handed parallel beta-helix repeat-containing protein [Methylovulum sp.]MDD2724772.1 right-handed parallel beta-helix repeat-containing protein [Methylovulum sp.]MDD5125937.1 right-handed parallel beta-helix repeat-containing protein [Methylovulum sp.]